MASILSFLRQAWCVCGAPRSTCLPGGCNGGIVACRNWLGERAAFAWRGRFAVCEKACESLCIALGLRKRDWPIVYKLVAVRVSLCQSQLLPSSQHGRATRDDKA